MTTIKNTRSQKIEERRASVRLSCQSPLSFKICKEETISKIMHGYTQDISALGVRCTIEEKVPIGCTLWLKFDRGALRMCEEIEKNTVILQQGILGKVAWIEKSQDSKFEVGLRFITREEKQSSFT